MPAPPITIPDVEQWNDAFAREHDIDLYYTRSGFLIRWIERCRLDLIRELLDARPGDRVLEVGCGGGHVLRMFPQCRLTGVDVSAEMLAKAKRNLDGYPVRLLKGEPSQVALPEGSFDRVICSEVLEHVVDPAGMLHDIHRLLAPTGRVVVTFPNDHLLQSLKNVVRRAGLSVLPPFRRISWGGDRYHLHVWTIGEMRELLAKFFHVDGVRFAPSRLLPIRCCFACTPTGGGSHPEPTSRSLSCPVR